MSDMSISAPRFDFGTAVTQLFNLPGGKGYLFRVAGFGTVLMTVLFVLLGIPILKAYVGMFESMMVLDSTAGMTEEEQLTAAFAMMAPIFAAMGWFTLLYFLQIGVYISVETALYCNIIRGEDKGLFPLRFGGDECKVLVTRLVVAMILYAVLMVAYIGLVLVGALAFGLGSATNSGVLIGVIGLIMGIAFLALIGAMIYGAIRLAPSAAFSVRDEAFSPVGSWGPMQPYFWPTLGAVLVVGLIGYIAMLIFSTLAFGVLFFASGLLPFITGQDFAENEIPDFSPLIETLTSAGFLVPAILILALATFLGFLYYGAIWSIWGYAAKLTDPRNIIDEYS